MAIPRIYWSGPVELGDTLTPDKKQHHHLLNVLRLESGDPVIIFGHGRSYQATLAMISKKKAALSVDVALESHTESCINTELAVCVYRGKQWDYGIQKSVELGVSSIQPIVSHKTDVPLNKTAVLKRADHNRQIIIAACEQCGRNSLPNLKEEQTLHDYLNDTQHIIACDFFDSSIDWGPVPPVNQRISILVGPAGGFTAEESERIKNSCALSLTLGPRTLRSDTACIVALTLVQAHWGDFKS